MVAKTHAYGNLYIEYSKTFEVIHKICPVFPQLFRDKTQKSFRATVVYIQNAPVLNFITFVVILLFREIKETSNAR